MEKVSYAGALKNKYVWIFGLGAGFFGLATVGIMSQLVSYFMAARGYELTGALSMLTIAAVIGMIGSWAWGVVDRVTWYTESLPAVRYLVFCWYRIFDRTSYTLHVHWPFHARRCYRR